MKETRVKDKLNLDVLKSQLAHAMDAVQELEEKLERAERGNNSIAEMLHHVKVREPSCYNSDENIKRMMQSMYNRGTIDGVRNNQ